MEAVGRLAGGVAHDFNNVLTAIFGYADLINDELPDGHQARQDLGEIRKAAQRASTLTRQLLAFSRQQVLQPVVLSLNDLVQDIEKMLVRLIGEDVQLRLGLSPHAGNVRADAGQIQQVLMNLVVNARDAMPAGGKLLIETAGTELTEQYAESHQPVVRPLGHTKWPGRQLGTARRGSSTDTWLRVIDVSCQLSAVSSQQSAISNQQSAVGR